MEVLATFDDFSRGHYGEDPRRPNGYFGGENFHVTPTGGLRIRDGTTALSNTGISNGTSFNLFPRDGFGGVVGIGTSAWSLNTGGAPTSHGAVFGASTTGNSTGWCAYGSGTLFTIDGDDTYNCSQSAISALGGVGGYTVAVLGDRIYVGGMSGNVNRIRYSDANNPTSWPATNFVDLGTGVDIITLMRRQRGSLLICTVGSGNLGNARWWRLSGTPGINQRLDEIVPRGPYTSPGDHRQFSADGAGSRIWFTPADPDTTQGWYGWVDTDTPVVSAACRPLNSTITTQQPTTGYQYAPVVGSPYTLALSAVFGSAVIQRTLLFHDTVPIGQMVWDYSDATLNSSSEFHLIPMHGLTGVVLGAGGTAAAKPTFQYWRPSWHLDVAPDETDGSGAAVTGRVLTPIIEDPSNAVLHVQAVTVDFRWYSSTTAMTCAVETHGLEENGGSVLGPQSSSSQAFTVSGAPSTVGQRARKTFYLGDVIPGNAALVKLTSCRGVAVERIRVLGQRYPSQT